MTVVNWVDADGTHTEEARNQQAAERREMKLRLRGVRFVVWYEVDSAPLDGSEARRSAVNASQGPSRVTDTGAIREGAA